MKKLLFLLFFIPLIGISQNKKEQIATLNFKLDSLNNKISNERQASKKEIEDNEKKISYQKAQLIKLYDRVKKLNESLESEKANLNTQKLKNIEIEKLNNKYEQQIGKLNERQESLSKANIQLKESLISYENGLKKLNENLVDSAGKISQLNNEIQKIYKLLAESKYENSLFIDSIKKLQTKKTATKLFFLKNDLGILFEGRLLIFEKNIFGDSSIYFSIEDEETIININDTIYELNADGTEDSLSQNINISWSVNGGKSIRWEIYNIQNKCYVVKTESYYPDGHNNNYDDISMFLLSYNDNQLKKKLVCVGRVYVNSSTWINGYELIDYDGYKVKVNECSGNCSFFNSFLKYHYYY